MPFREVLTVALAAVRTNLFRSILTCLGIIIGVASVIAMVALGEGAQKAMEERIQAMGSNLLTVVPSQNRAGGVARTDTERLTPEDARFLAENCTTCLEVLPEMSRQLPVVYLNANAQSSIVGTTANYPIVRNFELTAGRFFNPGEVEGRRRVAVLGAATLQQLGLNPVSAIGSEIRIREVPFEVIGTLNEKGQQGWQNPDEQILIPLDTARFRLLGTDRLRSIAIQVESANEMDKSMQEVEKILRRRHRLRPEQDSDFAIRNQVDALETLQESQKIFRLLLFSIASVSLLVGGIGIMNIMMVSVTERTREIGIRKALGATRRVILFQFLIEALVLCMLGGVIGIGLGVGLSSILAKTFGWRLVVTTWSVAVSFGFAAAIGIFFGIYPAGKASRLDPIQALRYE